MKFNYSRYNLGRKEARLERLLEIIPGLLSWAIILGMIFLSCVLPLLAAVIMIAFIVYWVMRLLYLNIFLILSYVRLVIEGDTDWMKYIDGVDKLDSARRPACKIEVPRNARNWISAFVYYRRLETLCISKDLPPKSSDIYHLVVIPVIKETREIVEPGILSMTLSKYPAQRILLVVTAEESASEQVKHDMRLLQETYRKFFLDFIFIVHPNNLSGEAKVKGANVSFAARAATSFFDSHNIAYENIIVSCFDADTVPTVNYFSCLAYHYMVTPNRTRASFQPIPVYYNNIWDAPSFARIIDIGASFFQLIEATNPKKLVTFSSHSMSFRALVEVGYWPIDMISDDSAIFWKAFVHYDGQYQTVPIYTTVSMDIATGRNWKETVVNIYKQKRRWAWGIENFPVVIRAFLESKTISLRKKITYGFKLLDSFVSWATWSFLLGFVSWLPAVFASREFASTTVYYIAPRIQQTIFILASFGILICMTISLLLLPRKKEGKRLSGKLLHAVEWVLIPVVILLFSALPALDAQTRLMFGKYMEFWTADKGRKKSEKKRISRLIKS